MGTPGSRRLLLLIGLWLAAYSLAVHAQLLSALPDPILNDDVPSYLSPALHSILIGRFDLGPARPPGYPWLLRLILGSGGGFFPLLALQHVAVLLTGVLSGLIYYRRFRASPAEAMALAFLVSVLPKALLFSHTIMTESVFQLLLICGVGLFLSCLDEGGLASWGVLGLVVAAAIALRPSGKPLLVVFPAAAALLAKGRRRIGIAIFASAAGLSLAAICAWSAAHRGFFGTERFAGLSLFGTAARYIEPSRVADDSLRKALKDYYEPNRDPRLASANWVRYSPDGPAIAVSKALGSRDLDPVYAALSRQAILTHPVLFAADQASEVRSFLVDGSNVWPLTAKDVLASNGAANFTSFISTGMPAARWLFEFREGDEAYLRRMAAYPFDSTPLSLPLYGLFGFMKWLPCLALVGSIPLAKKARFRPAVLALWAVIGSMIIVSTVGANDDYYRHSMPLEPLYFILAFAGLASILEEPWLN
jgi:hypothetical protein